MGYGLYIRDNFVFSSVFGALTRKLVYLLGTLFMQEFSRLSKRNALSKFFKLIRFLVCRNKGKDLKELLEKKMSGKKWLTLLS